MKCGLFDVNAYSSCSQRYYNYLYSLCLCLELTNRISVVLHCSHYHTFRDPSVI